jgi:hypothetical protein
MCAPGQRKAKQVQRRADYPHSLRNGYRRLWRLLRQEGWLINASTRLSSHPKGVCRLYPQQGLSLRHNSKKPFMASCFPIFSSLTTINQQWR